MAIILSHPMTTQEIRVLQEFRRVGKEILDLATIKAIKHPTGGGEAPALSLVKKGYLTAEGENFALTQKAKEFLAIDVKPKEESAGGTKAASE